MAFAGAGCPAGSVPLSEPNIIAVLSEWRVEPVAGELGELGGIALARGGHGGLLA